MDADYAVVGGGVDVDDHTIGTGDGHALDGEHIEEPQRIVADAHDELLAVDRAAGVLERDDRRAVLHLRDVGHLGQGGDGIGDCR